MHQFLDQLLNNPPAKKRSQTQTSSEMVKRNSEQQRMQQFNELQRKDSQPGINSSSGYQNGEGDQQNSGLSQGTRWKQGQDESSEYEVEEITEQIVFEDDGAHTAGKKLQGFMPRVRESLEKLQASRQQQEQQVLQVYSPSQYKQYKQQPNQNQPINNTSNIPAYNPYFHASNRRPPTSPHQPIVNQFPSSQLMSSEVHKNITSRRSISNTQERGSINMRTVEGLINGINSAKESQMELMKWFGLERQSFGEFISAVMGKIQLEIRRVLERANLNKEQLEQSVRGQLTSSIRRQLQQQYRERLQQEKSLIELSQIQRQRQVGQQTIPRQISQTMSRKQSTPPSSKISTQHKWQIQKKVIKQQLEQRYQYRLQKLQQQLQQQRKYSQQLIKTYQQSNKPSSRSSGAIGNNKNNQRLEVDEEVRVVRKLLEERDRMIGELEVEIERLNEHIFDVEQQVEGVELEVENRVRDKVKMLEVQHQKALLQLKDTRNTNSHNNLHNNNYNNTNNHHPQSPIPQLNPILQHSSHLQQSSRLFGLQSIHPNNHLHQQLTQIQLQNQHLKKIIFELQQQKNSIELQLKEQEKIIVFREEQVKKNEEDIAYEWSEVQKERQATFGREQELATAEQNISRKISQIRNKQIDLDKWQTQLQKRQLALDLRQHEINQQLQQLVHQTNLHKQFTHNHKPIRNQRQSISVTSNQNRLSRQNLNDFYIQGGAGSFRPNGVDIPQLPIGKKNYQHQQITQEKTFDHDYAYRNKPHDIVSKGNFEKSFEDPDRSYTRQNISRERMIITSTNFRSNRANPNSHQFVLPQTSKAQRHSRSKSRSKQKPVLKNNFVNGSSSISTNSHKNPSFKGKYIDDYYQNKQTNNLDGLGSKLQRLRDEIKREIDSIK